MPEAANPFARRAGERVAEGGGSREPLRLHRKQEGQVNPSALLAPFHTTLGDARNPVRARKQKFLSQRQMQAIRLSG